jgi:transcriptional regulator with XRE-family HTH domain
MSRSITHPIRLCFCARPIGTMLPVAALDIRPAFGQRVRDLRTSKGLTQEALAERADLHTTYVSGIERGLRSPRLHVVVRIADALGVTMEQLFAGVLSSQRQRRTSFKVGRPKRALR